jgi:hypothetical protein
MVPDLFALTCPSCGGKLQITPDIDRFSCGHCGNEHVVKRSGGAITVEPVLQALGEIRIGTDKTASELAMKRLTEELSRMQLAKAEALESISTANAAIRQLKAKEDSAHLAGIGGVVALVFLVGFVAVQIAAALLWGGVGGHDAPFMLPLVSFLVAMVAVAGGCLLAISLLSYLGISAPVPLAELHSAIEARSAQLEEIERDTSRSEHELEVHRGVVSRLD